MAAGRPSNRAELANRAAQAVAPAGEDPKPRTIYQLIDDMKGEIARALPRHMDADRLARVAVTTLRQTPRLLECTPQSLLGALMLSAQLGLEPGPLGHAYLVPFKNGRTGNYEVTWILGYKGIIDLAQRSGKLLSIESREVYTNDEFSFEYGLDPKLVHRPVLDGERGEPRAYYGVAHFKDGGRYFLVMSKRDVDARRSRSKAKDSGPWVTDYDAMARKTVIRAMAPFLPLTVELAGAIAHDESVHREITEAMVEMPPPPQIIEGELGDDPEQVDPQTGEISEATEPSVEETRQQILDQQGEPSGWPEDAEQGR